MSMFSSVNILTIYLAWHGERFISNRTKEQKGLGNQQRMGHTKVFPLHNVLPWSGWFGGTF